MYETCVATGHSYREHVEKEVVDVHFVQVVDDRALSVTESVPDVVVPEHHDVLLGGEVTRELSVPLQVFAVPVAEEDETLGRKMCKTQSSNSFCTQRAGHFWMRPRL